MMLLCMSDMIHAERHFYVVCLAAYMEEGMQGI